MSVTYCEMVFKKLFPYFLTAVVLEAEMFPEYIFLEILRVNGRYLILWFLTLAFHP